MFDNNSIDNTLFDMFDMFDIWCINLQHRTDRREKMEQLFRDMNIRDQVKFYEPTLDPRGGRIGCFQSHYNCLTTSTRPYIIIFEDDCELNVEFLNWNQVLEDAKKMLEWCDYFSIACVPIYETAILRETEPFKILLGSFTTTLCYAIKRSTVQQIREDLLSCRETDHIDYFYWKKLRACGYVNPLFKQCFGKTDNIWLNNYVLNHFLRMFASQYYANHIGSLFSRRLCTLYYVFQYYLKHYVNKVTKPLFFTIQ
jgi:GR25 family glycosyltransferase involved in LPS biosynthesis